MSERILTIKIGSSIQFSLAFAQQMIKPLTVGEDPILSLPQQKVA